MWAEVWKIIERLVSAKDLGVERINEILGVELTSTVDSPLVRRYRATLPAGPLREVELRSIPQTGLSFLVLRPDPDRPVKVGVNDLRSFGRPKWTSDEPNAGPEGEVSEGYELPGMMMSVGYRSRSRQLEAVSLEKSP
jgi:hypothetical protein